MACAAKGGRKFAGAEGDGDYSAEKEGVGSSPLAGFQGALRFGQVESLRLVVGAVIPTLARYPKLRFKSRIVAQIPTCPAENTAQLS